MKKANKTKLRKLTPPVIRVSTVIKKSTSFIEKITPSYRSDWNTPKWLITLIEQFNGGIIGLDPCSNPDSLTRAETEWYLERDGDSLQKPWGNYGLVFINPPYKKEIVPFVDKILLEAQNGVEQLVLIPARTDTKWFHKLIDGNQAPLICLIKGRLKFLGAKHSAPFPSALVYFGNRGKQFTRLFGTKGIIFGQE